MREEQISGVATIKASVPLEGNLWLVTLKWPYPGRETEVIAVKHSSHACMRPGTRVHPRRIRSGETCIYVL